MITKPALRAAAVPLFLALAAVPLAAKTAPRNAGAPAASPAIIPLPLKQIIPAPQRVCSAKTASGLGYKVLRSATGDRPATGGTVTVNYIGYLTASGEVFDQSTGASFPLGGVIPGFSEGLAMMQTGSIYRLCIPAALAYGDRVVGPIPANSDLVFQVELLPNPPAPPKAK